MSIILRIGLPVFSIVERLGLSWICLTSSRKVSNFVWIQLCMSYSCSLTSDVIKSVWSQKTALIGQLLSTAHRKLPMPAQREKVKKSLTDSIKNRFNIGKGQPQNKSDLRIPSPLRLTVQGSSSSRPASIDQVSLYSSSDEDLPEDEGIDPSSYESVTGPRLTAEPETMSVSSHSEYGTDATTKAVRRDLFIYPSYTY